MKYTNVAAAALLTAMLTVTGCKKPPLEQCAPGDSPEVCKQVQTCFKSGTAVDVCREGEKDANAIQSNKSLDHAHKGEADALSYDPSKALQQPAAEQPRQQPKKP